MNPTLEGGCACGKMRYRLTSQPMFVHCCHCKDCQRQTGSAFVINALIETGRVEKLTGETKAVAVPTDSGRPHDIHRCPSCENGGLEPLRGSASALHSSASARSTSRRNSRPTCIFIRARNCPGWRCRRTFRHSTAYYDSKTLWPPESLERRKAIFG